MNIATNPWTFVSGDVPAAITPVAAPNGFVQQASSGPGLAGVLLTTTAPHGLLVGQFITVINTTGGRFLGWYKVAAVPSATTALLQNLSSPTSGQPFNTVLAGDGGGSVLVNQIQQNVRAEDMSIQALTAAPTAGLLSILDRNGIVLWTAQLGAAAPAGSQNRGKLMWVDGITLQSIPANWELLVTIN